MGLDRESVRFLLQARAAGTKFDKSLTLGRQHYFLCHAETKQLFKEFGIDPGAHPNLFPDEYPHYSDPFWQVLGAEELETMDASDFECASIVHDLNKPVSADLHSRFDAVCDVGTLEHVFNFPTALKSCLSMVRPGGYFFAFTTANNYFGHGFYQFSPELFYRILNETNGFQMERMVAVEYGPGRRWYDVADPARINSRVTLINGYPVLLFVQAKRIHACPILNQTPQQSDYETMWIEGGKNESYSAGDLPSFFQKLKRSLLETSPSLSRMLESTFTSYCDKTYSFRNRKMFKPSNKGTLT